MTDMGMPRGTAGPPWPVDLLADLHAGALDEAQAAELWPQVRADAEAMAVLDALDATKADLATLSAAPVAPMPADIAARLDAALAEESSRTPVQQVTPDARGHQPGQPERLAPVVDIAAARRKRNRMMGWGAGLVSTAAAAVAAVAILSPDASTTGTPQAGEGTNQNGAAGPSFSVSPERPEAAFSQLNGVQDYGPLESREGLEECLAAHEIPTTGQTAGVKPGKVEGKDAVIAVLTTGKTATYRIIAVSPECSSDDKGEVYINKVFGLGGG